MSVIENAGLGTPLQNAGVPVAGTDEVQRLTIGGTPTGGTFTLSLDGFTTGPIDWNATTGTLLTNIETAVEALPNVDAVTVADVSLAAGIGDLDITFDGANVAKKAQNLMTADGAALTGTAPTVSVAEQTAGVTATHRSAPTGARLTDITNGVFLHQH